MNSKRNSGFTLIELAVVISITGILGAAVFLNLFNYRSEQNLKLTITEAAAVLRDTQKRAISQENGRAWGVNFINPETDKDRYEVYGGPSSTSGIIDKTYVLSRGVKFGSPFASSAADAAFSPVTGLLSENRVITLIGPGSDPPIADIILTTLGALNTRIEKNILAYWHFDDSTSTIAYDSSFSPKNGRLFDGSNQCTDGNLGGGCPTWVRNNCKAGDCIGFDGDNDYIDTPFILSPNYQSFSAELWVNPNQNGDDFAILQQKGPSGRTWLYRNDRDSLCSSLFLIPFWGCLNSKVIPSNTWSHIALAVDKDTNTVKIYLNGQVQGTGPGIILPAIGGLFIGRHNNPNAMEEWPGLIDELRVYGRMLTDQEILAHYNDLK